MLTPEPVYALINESAVKNSEAIDLESETSFGQ